MDVQINYDAIRKNTAAVMEYAGKPIFAVVKNNAYNTGLAAAAGAIADGECSHFIVTQLEDAYILRESLPDAYVLVSNPVIDCDFSLIRAQGIALMIPSLAWLVAHGEFLPGIELHLKVNVGMNRFGVNSFDEADAVIAFVRDKGLLLTGIYGHFPLAGEKEVATHDQQIDLFVAYYTHLSQNWNFVYIHAENSVTMLARDQRLAFCNYARVGIVLYGYAPQERLSWLEPCLRVQAQIIAIEDRAAGTYLGYGTSTRLDAAARIAVAAIGYGDGMMQERLQLPFYDDEHQYLAAKMTMSHLFLIVDSTVQIGDWLEVYGAHVQIDDVMRATRIPNSQQLAYLHIDRGGL